MLLVKFFEEYHMDIPNKMPEWSGYLIVGLMFVSQLLKSILENAFFHRVSYPP